MIIRDDCQNELERDTVIFTAVVGTRKNAMHHPARYCWIYKVGRYTAGDELVEEPPPESGRRGPRFRR